MTEPPLPSLDKLGARIKALRQAEAQKTAPSGSASTGNMSQAMRLASDLISGVCVGGFIGYQLDRWLGTSPWLFILFLCFGLAAGVKLMLGSIQASDKQSNE